MDVGDEQTGRKTGLRVSSYSIDGNRAILDEVVRELHSYDQQKRL